MNINATTGKLSRCEKPEGQLHRPVGPSLYCLRAAGHPPPCLVPATCDHCGAILDVPDAAAIMQGDEPQHPSRVRAVVPPNAGLVS